MTTPGTFGRRSASRPAPAGSAGKTTSPRLDRLFPAAPVSASQISAATPTIASLGKGEGASEIDAWKAGRKFRWPWRQLSLIAGLSFGIGGLVLPDSVTGVTDIVLYALMAVSFCVGIFGKDKPK